MKHGFLKLGMEVVAEMILMKVILIQFMRVLVIMDVVIMQVIVLGLTGVKELSVIQMKQF